MNKKLVFLLICITMIISLTGCGGKEISFYFGTSETAKNNTSLELNKSVAIKQNKEKIENSDLVFNKNDKNTFDNMYLCFDGKNIKNVTAKSENKTILYDHYDTVTRCVDMFSLYYYVNPSEIDENFNPMADFAAKWDSGQFNEIKNVYFDGMTSMEISRTRKDPSKQIAGVDAYLWKADNLKDCDEFYYLDKKQKINSPVVVVDILKRAADPNFKKELADKPDDAVIPGEKVKTNNNVTQDSFIYRYEKLFYISQQKALKSKNSFDYYDLKGETVDIAVNYNDGSKENYKLNISFDENGNINAELTTEVK